jgi:hypothetical protein
MSRAEKEFEKWRNQKPEGRYGSLHREHFMTVWETAVYAALEAIDKCRYDAPDIPDDHLRGLDSASNAVGELRE